MNSAQLIERDLVRWRRGKWIAVIAIVFALQLGLFIWASQKHVRERAVYPPDPKVAFAAPPGALDRLDRSDREWLEMENPFLFVAWWSFIFSMIVTIVVSLLTPKDPEEKLRGLTWSSVVHSDEAQGALEERNS